MVVSGIGIRRRERKQKGQRIETPTAFFLRYYITTADGQRKKAFIKLADKSEKFKTWADVEHLIAQELDRANGQSNANTATGATNLTDFVEKYYLPWVETNKAAVTAYGYRRVWEVRWKPHLGKVTLTGLETAHITKVLTALAKDGMGKRTLSHAKWFLSGVYEFAIAQGIAKENPAVAAKWLHSVTPPKKQKVYSMAEVQAILNILEPLNLRAAVAVAMAYFTALRPAEIRGLEWADFDGEYLHIKRSVWRNHIGRTKTEDSAGSLLTTEPLRGLLEKLRCTPIGEATNGEKAPVFGDCRYILDSGKGRAVSLDSLNFRVIAPACKSAGIQWRGYYAGRRGISTEITNTSKNALNSTGLLRHSTPITALKHYTRAQKDSIEAAQRVIEEQYKNLARKETVQ